MDSTEWSDFMTHEKRSRVTDWISKNGGSAIITKIVSREYIDFYGDDPFSKGDGPMEGSGSNIHTRTDGYSTAHVIILLDGRLFLMWDGIGLEVDDGWIAYMEHMDLDLVNKINKWTDVFTDKPAHVVVDIPITVEDKKQSKTRRGGRKHNKKNKVLRLTGGGNSAVNGTQHLKGKDESTGGFVLRLTGGGTNTALDVDVDVESPGLPIEDDELGANDADQSEDDDGYPQSADSDSVNMNSPPSTPNIPEMPTDDLPLHLRISTDLLPPVYGDNDDTRWFDDLVKSNRETVKYSTGLHDENGVPTAVVGGMGDIGDSREDKWDRYVSINFLFTTWYLICKETSAYKHGQRMSKLMLGTHTDQESRQYLIPADVKKPYTLYGVSWTMAHEEYTLQLFKIVKRILTKLEVLQDMEDVGYASVTKQLHAALQNEENGVNRKFEIYQYEYMRAQRKLLDGDKYSYANMHAIKRRRMWALHSNLMDLFEQEIRRTIEFPDLTIEEMIPGCTSMAMDDVRRESPMRLQVMGAFYATACPKTDVTQGYCKLTKEEMDLYYCKSKRWGINRMESLMTDVIICESIDVENQYVHRWALILDGHKDIIGTYGLESMYDIFSTHLYKLFCFSECESDLCKPHWTDIIGGINRCKGILDMMDCERIKDDRWLRFDRPKYLCGSFFNIEEYPEKYEDSPWWSGPDYTSESEYTNSDADEEEEEPVRMKRERRFHDEPEFDLLTTPYPGDAWTDRCKWHGRRKVESNGSDTRLELQNEIGSLMNWNSPAGYNNTSYMFMVGIMVIIFAASIRRVDGVEIEINSQD